MTSRTRIMTLMIPFRIMTVMRMRMMTLTKTNTLRSVKRFLQKWDAMYIHLTVLSPPPPLFFFFNKTR
jgi:hypothetical protein